ncbi:hypothetical protein [Motilibacter rhizosphaerae]|nr:hypothetical protein [Motilibacter rhizosphaerae]
MSSVPAGRLATFGIADTLPPGIVLEGAHPRVTARHPGDRVEVLVCRVAPGTNLLGGTLGAPSECLQLTPLPGFHVPSGSPRHDLQIVATIVRGTASPVQVDGVDLT